MGKSNPATTEPADELQTFFAEKQVGPYLVKPWSFGKAIKVYPSIAQAVTRLKEMGKSWGELIKAFEVGESQEVLQAILPVLPPLVAATLGISQEEAEGLDMGLGAALALTIISQNLTQIKNYLPLVMESTKAIIRAT